jgi:hypothetical protein
VNNNNDIDYFINDNLNSSTVSIDSHTKTAIYNNSRSSSRVNSLALSHPSPYISNLRKRIISSEDLNNKSNYHEKTPSKITTVILQNDGNNNNSNNNFSSVGSHNNNDSSRESSLDFQPEIIELKSGRRKSLSKQDSESLRLARSQHYLLNDRKTSASVSQQLIENSITASNTNNNSNFGLYT